MIKLIGLLEVNTRFPSLTRRELARFIPASTLALLVLCVTACDFNAEDKTTNTSGSSDQQAVVIRASVNGTPITQTDIDETVERTLQNVPTTAINAALKKKVLDSLVIMRALSLEQEKTLNEQQKSNLAAQVARYKEELLVEQYLRHNTEPKPPSLDDIQAYYDAHIDRYKVAEQRGYEVLRANRLDDNNISSLIAQLTQASTQQDWREQANRLSQQGHSVSYVAGRTDGPAIDQRLLAVINQLSLGESSHIVYIDKQPVLVRVTDIQKSTPTPLAEVRTDIRKTLAVENMKAAIKQASDRIMDMTDVEYR